MLGLTGALPAAEPDAEPPRWGARADAAISRAVALDDGSGAPFHYAALADAIARRSRDGWRDPRARRYLDRVRAAKLPNGGWGLGYAWDAFSDGTVNPATTTYTITLSGHVGPLLLDAHEAGVVPRAEVAALVRRLGRQPTVPVALGQCVAYSDHPNDVRAGYCVHNVNASVAQFLLRAREAGLPVDLHTVARITQQEVATYLPGARSWRYMDGRPGLNDWPHNAMSIEAILAAAPGIGLDAVDWTMRNRDPAEKSWYLHAALAPWRCDRSLRWLAEFDTAMSSPTNRTFALQAQAAQRAARAAEACDRSRGAR